MLGELALQNRSHRDFNEPASKQEDNCDDSAAFKSARENSGSHPEVSNSQEEQKEVDSKYSSGLPNPTFDQDCTTQGKSATQTFGHEANSDSAESEEVNPGKQAVAHGRPSAQMKSATITPAQSSRSPNVGIIEHQFTLSRIEDGFGVLVSQDNLVIEIPTLVLPGDAHSGQIFKFKIERQESLEEQRKGDLISMQR